MFFVNNNKTKPEGVECPLPVTNKKNKSYAKEIEMQANNKYKINTFGAVLLLLMVLFFSGCSDENTVISEADENTIAFDCSASALRAVKTTAADMQYFRVSAVWDKGDSIYEPYMNKQLVEKQNEGWVYSPVKHWPAYGSVSFFAYAPAISSGIKSFDITDTHQLTIDYELTTDNQKQEDLMIAVGPEKTASPIYLKFNHVLSNVNIKVRGIKAGTTFRIKEIGFTNLCSKARFTCVGINTSTPFWVWYEQKDPEKYSVYQKYSFETEDAYKELGSLMVIPQNKDLDNFKIRVLYDIVGGAEDQIGEYTLNDEFEFEMGKKYTFYLDLSSQLLRSQQQSIHAPKIKCHIVSEPIGE